MDSAAYVHRLATGKDAALSGTAIAFLYVVAKLSGLFSLVGLAYTGKQAGQSWPQPGMIAQETVLCRDSRIWGGSVVPLQQSRLSAQGLAAGLKEWLCPKTFLACTLDRRLCLIGLVACVRSAAGCVHAAQGVRAEEGRD